MSQINNLLNQLWSKLSQALDEIFQFRPMSREAYMVLYNSVEKYFRSAEYSDNLIIAGLNRPKPNAETDKNTSKKQEKQIDANIPGGELYFNIKNFFRQYLENLAANGDNLKGEAFLEFYAKTWEKYQFSSQIANGILSMVNRNWVTRQQKDGFKGVYDIYTTAMYIWQDIFFKEPTRSLTQTCLNLINDERNGIRIDGSLIKKVVQSYATAGFINSEKNEQDNRSLSRSLATYVDYFEKEFLQQSEHFYKLETTNFLQNNSVNDFMKKANERLKEEERRVQDYLHPTTLEKLNRILEQIFIIDQLEALQTEIINVLRYGKIEDVRIGFELINRVANGNDPVQKDLETYAHEVGMDTINRISANANKEPKVYVEAIIETHQKFSNIVNQGFANHQIYTAAMDRAFSNFVNANVVTREAGKSAKSSELLARYCDIILRKGNKAEDSDVEEKINQIMIVFNYIEDKDVFQKFYGKMLAKRLVNQLTASDDYEELMISRLKAACGFEYASKLQRMFQDIRLSTTLVNEFKNETEIGDFSVMVLTSNSWPFTAPPTFNLPIELKRTLESFTNYYSKKFTGRKLEWLYQHSKGDLQTLYTKPKYTLQVSTYQMTLLLLFNEFESLTVEKMLDQTQIESELFTQVLIGLLKSGILISPQIDSSQLNDNFKENNIQMNFIIQIDETFKSKKMKINLNQPIRSVEQKETDTVNQSVDEDRKILIQAAIVRIMKARKELKHALLIQEVIPQLSSRFKPQIPMIKKCIDMLIEKEYLERDSKERDLFRYLA